jgi:hypothetical protein
MSNTNGKKKFRIRITGFETKPAASFQFNPLNWRRHGDVQRDALRTMLGDVGWVQGVIENRRTGNLIDGHARIEEALRDDPKQLVPYLVVDLSPAEERAVLATLDPIGALAEVDQAALDLLYEQTIIAMPGLEELLTTLHYAGASYTEPDENTTIERAVALQKKWKVKRGELWEIGRHRLRCGDSTNASDAAALMAGQRAEMMFTDPPYGVDYDGGMRIREKFTGDHNTDLYAEFLPVALKHVDGPCYVWFAGHVARELYNAIRASSCEIYAAIIWSKNHGQFATRKHYKVKHEACLYFKTATAASLRWIGPANECTLWEVDRESVNEWHPTQKPVELAARAIGNHDAKLIVDWFAGSGSTMVAAELARRHVLCDGIRTVLLRRGARTHEHRVSQTNDPKNSRIILWSTPTARNQNSAFASPDSKPNQRRVFNSIR